MVAGRRGEKRAPKEDEEEEERGVGGERQGLHSRKRIRGSVPVNESVGQPNRWVQATAMVRERTHVGDGRGINVPCTMHTG